MSSAVMTNSPRGPLYKGIEGIEGFPLRLPPQNPRPLIGRSIPALLSLAKRGRVLPVDLPGLSLAYYRLITAQ